MRSPATTATTSAGVYRALQIYGVVAPFAPLALTVAALNLGLARERNPLFAALLAPSLGWGGVALVTAIRLAVTASIIGQSAYCWRVGAPGSLTRRLGCAMLLVWAALVSVDMAHDVSVLWAQLAAAAR